MVPKVGVGEVWTGSLGLVDANITFRMDKQQGPRDSTGNYFQSPGINHNGKECFKKSIYICMYNSHLLYSRDWHISVNQLDK